MSAGKIRKALVALATALMLVGTVAATAPTANAATTGHAYCRVIKVPAQRVECIRLPVYFPRLGSPQYTNYCFVYTTYVERCV